MKTTVAILFALLLSGTAVMATPATMQQDTVHKRKPKDTVNKQWHSKHKKDTTSKKTLLPPKHNS